ncbi:putative phage protein [Candidatus Hepatincola sp. Pdp]
MRISKIQQKIWNSIRVFKVFSVKDIQFSSGETKPLNYQTVWKYLVFLESAGYIRLTGRQTYKLVKCTGKLAPCTCGIRTKLFCFDPNTNKNIELQKPYRQEHIHTRAKSRLPLILDAVTVKESFKLKDIISISGNYDRSKHDLIVLQKLGFIKCIHGHKNGATKIFKIIKNNKEEVRMKKEDFIPIPEKIKKQEKDNENNKRNYKNRA